MIFALKQSIFELCDPIFWENVPHILNIKSGVIYTHIFEK